MFCGILNHLFRNHQISGNQKECEEINQKYIKEEIKGSSKEKDVK